MRKNIKLALRLLHNNKIYASINFIGLAIALTSSFIIFLFIINELSYNNCHRNEKRVFRVLNYYEKFDKTLTGTPYILASTLINEFPQIERAVRTRSVNNFKLKVKDDFIRVQNVIATDSEIFDIFTIPIIEGSLNNNLLKDQYSLVLSKGLSEKLFPDRNPIGKEILGWINNKEEVFIVTGIFSSPPINSTFQAHCLINSKLTIEPINKAFGISTVEKSWEHDFWNTWVLLSKNTDFNSFIDLFSDFENKYLGVNPQKHFSLQNLSDVYLKSDQIGNSGIRGNIRNVRMFSIIALILIFVASSNYIVISTAVSTNRTKEIGIRQTFGAGISNIKLQILSESILLAVLVLPISLLLMLPTIPLAEKLFKTELPIIGSNVFTYLSAYLILTVVVGIVSGGYTSFYLSRLNVLDIIKNTYNSGKQRFYFRSTLLVIQLVIFCSFVACSLIIRSQYKFALGKELGYHNSNTLLIDLTHDFKGYSSFLNHIKSIPSVINAAGVMEGIPMQGTMSSMYSNFRDNEIKVQVEGLEIDYDFLNTMGIKIIDGRDFSNEYGSDLHNSIILNETAIRQLEIDDPLGQKISNKEIIGIVKDFNLHSIHSDIPPLIIQLTDEYINQIVVHYYPGALEDVLPKLKTSWKSFAPDKPFRFSTIEDLIKDLYSSERNLTNIVSVFSVFILIIATLGIFGLTLFFIQTRKKEISIRKVLGCKSRSIVYSYIIENFILVSIATIISIPITILLMSKWLTSYSYKVNIDISIFVLVYVLVSLVVLLTVYFQSIKASNINPVKELRSY